MNIEIICEDLKDAADNGEIILIDWLTEKICDVEELAELGVDGALTLMESLRKIAIHLNIIKIEN